MRSWCHFFRIISDGEKRIICTVPLQSAFFCIFFGIIWTFTVIFFTRLLWQRISWPYSAEIFQIQPTTTVGGTTLLQQTSADRGKDLTGPTSVNTFLAPSCLNGEYTYGRVLVVNVMWLSTETEGILVSLRGSSLALRGGSSSTACQRLPGSLRMGLLMPWRGARKPR